MGRSMKSATSEARTLVSHPELTSHKSFPSFRTGGEPPRGPLERFLSFFADVRAGEGTAALLMMVTVFILLASYYLLKVAREQLVLTEGSAIIKAQASGAQAILLMAVVPIFGWLGTKVNRIRLITITSLFFAGNLLLFYVLGQAGVREGVVFYIWLGIYNLFVISQFWAFANDIYTEGQGRRLFPLIGVGASLGAWIGSTSVPTLIKTYGFTPYTLMLAGAIMLVMALAVTRVINHMQRNPSQPEAAKIEAATLGKEGGFQLIWKDVYLRWIAILIVLLNVVNTTGEYLLSELITRAAPPGEEAAEDFIGVFYGQFFGWLNLVGFVLQLFFASRAIRYLGVRGSLFILPVIALLNYSVIAVVPLLAVVRIGKILENATDYSIQNTVRHALFLPTSREVKYKAKNAIDTFFTRVGDVIAAGVATLGVYLGWQIPGFGYLMIAFTLVWLFVALQIAREHRKKTA